MRLIDADTLKDFTYINKGNFNTVEGIREWIDNAPTVEYPFYQEAYQTGYEEGKNERTQGEWVHSIANGWECTNCNQTIKEMPTTYNRKGAYNFCPNCGADMKGGAEK